MEEYKKNSPLACSAHNDYLEFLYDYGVIGLALLLSFMLKFGRLVIGLIRKSQTMQLLQLLHL